MSWLAPHWRRPRHAPGEPLEALVERGFIAIDLETTGLDSRTDRIVAMAAVGFVDGEPGPPLMAMLVDPGRPIPGTSTAIHGIDDGMVAGALAEAEAVQRLDEACANQVVVGHGLAFDLAVLTRARGGPAVPPPLATVCTMRLAAWLHPGWSDLSLDTVAGAAGLAIANRHTAVGDAVGAGLLLLRLLPALRARGVRTFGELMWVQDSVTLAR